MRTPMLMTKSGHASIRTLSCYSRPSVRRLGPLAGPTRSRQAPTAALSKTHPKLTGDSPLQDPVPIQHHRLSRKVGLVSILLRE